MYSAPPGECTVAPASHWKQDDFLCRFAGWSALSGLTICPSDTVLTYKNLIYLLNLQFIALKLHQFVKFTLKSVKSGVLYTGRQDS